MKTQIKTSLLLVIAFTFLRAGAQSSAQTLFSDNFDTDTSANWSIFDGSGNGTSDFTFQFGFDYSTNRYIANGVTNTIPSAPNSGGSTRGLKLTVNKNDNTAATAAVSLFPKNATFANSYALRADMWLNYNGPAYGGTGSTEFGAFGLHHAGDKVIWNDASATGDGVWFAVAGEAGAGNTPLSDYNAYVGDGASAAVRLQGSDGGFLDRDGNGSLEFEANPAQAASVPLKLMFPSPQFESAGAPGKHWVKVEVRQRASQGVNTVTWLLDGYVIAEHSQGDALGQKSGKIMIGYLDPYSSISDPKADNFVIFDNLRVVNLDNEPVPPVVSISSTDQTAAEPGADSAGFTISRTGPTTNPLAVQLNMGGTALNGVDYTRLTNSITIPAGASATNITVTVLNDSIGEEDETVIITLAGSQFYDVRDSISTTITIADDGDVPVATLTVPKPVAYESNPLSVGQFRVNLSTPNSTATPVHFTIGGTAAIGIDYAAIADSVTVPAGATNVFINIAAKDNNVIDSDRTIVLTLTPRAGYALGTATNGTVTIRNDDLPAGTLLYSENFDADNAAWSINQGPGDGSADFFFDYGTVGIPSAPHSANGTTRGLKLQANVSSGIFGGLSVSPAEKEFAGDYRLRFDMWLNYNGPLPAGGNGSTQVTGAGVGTSGKIPQWAGGTQDSVWFGSTGEGGSAVDYRAYSSAASSGYVETNGVFAAGTVAGVRNNTHAYYAQFGAEAAPAAQLTAFPNQTGVTPVGGQGLQWRDVVITKQGNEVSWSIDGLRLATVNTTTVTFGGGNILFNHFDINAGSSTDPNAASLLFGLFDNVRIERLSTVTQPPNIGATKIVGGNIEINFTGASSDSPTAFKLQSSTTLTGFTDVAGVTVTQTSPGNFRATVAQSGPIRFFRVAR